MGLPVWRPATATASKDAADHDSKPKSGIASQHAQARSAIRRQPSVRRRRNLLREASIRSPPPDPPSRDIPPVPPMTTAFGSLDAAEFIDFAPPHTDSTQQSLHPVYLRNTDYRPQSRRGTISTSREQALAELPPLRRMAGRSINDASPRSPDGLTATDRTTLPRFLNGLGDRERSWSLDDDGEDNGARWDTLLTTITPDPSLPSAGSSFDTVARGEPESRLRSFEQAVESIHQGLWGAVPSTGLPPGQVSFSAQRLPTPPSIPAAEDCDPADQQTTTITVPGSPSTASHTSSTEHVEITSEDRLLGAADYSHQNPLYQMRMDAFNRQLHGMTADLAEAHDRVQTHLTSLIPTRNAPNPTDSEIELALFDANEARLALRAVYSGPQGTTARDDIALRNRRRLESIGRTRQGIENRAATHRRQAAERRAENDYNATMDGMFEEMRRDVMRRRDAGDAADDQAASRSSGALGDAMFELMQREGARRRSPGDT